MKRKMKKIFAVATAVTVTMSLMSVSVLAADSAKIHGGEDLGGSSIKVDVNDGTDGYTFNSQGGHWESEGAFPELGLGKGDEMGVTITDGNGDKYTASLVGKNDGNLKDSEKGTDQYDFCNVTRIPAPDPNPDPDPDPTPDPPTRRPQRLEPEEEPEEVVILDEDAPQAEASVVEETQEVAEEELFEEEVPMTEIPKTGDPMGLWMTLSGVSAAGLFLLNKKRED